MNLIACIEPGKLKCLDVSKPDCLPGYSLIRVKRVGICGTDIHAFEGNQPYFSYPRVLGHELAGEFVSGDTPGLRKGDVVTMIPYQHCNTCVACRGGYTNCCQHMNVIGVHSDGGMAEFLQVPSHLLLSAEGLDLNQVALVEPFAIAAHAVRRAGITPADNVLVIGVGPIGLAIIEMATIAGAKVMAIDINENRMGWAKHVAGAKEVFDGKAVNLEEQIREATNGDMPTVVLDATGNRNAINDAFRFMAHSGRFILVGIQKGMIEFNHPEFHKREGTLMSSRNATREDFEHVLECIRMGRISPENYITHFIHFDELVDQFPHLVNEPGLVKAIVRLD
ncbi:2-desacetyl-2-hydroxyethyl bacteriochlorophyllide A dehydrogenase [Chitinophaga dinghuensis]|uniref:2-desacetyl-2-hydroxyethyl bacteriochlorophyllide A dehydrogenase n=1 Tax=Chitinophaga dinghuensis TaxID=1539050 RepID=A0A327VPQ4_9BACT|nr:zinc-binding alcohol dehydrogenase family protein [Chitinophaga dinghuensis]RAJ77315.1 2-desacetyl-2-hydroxyethyl bacteriochlorophyllide A dehydrogenase [Chitinophaga dinghuensis]